MFCWPSGAKVSSSRAPPPNVITTTFRFGTLEARAKEPELSTALPSIRCAALRRKSRRLWASPRASSPDELAFVRLDPVSRIGKKQDMKTPTAARNYDCCFTKSSEIHFSVLQLASLLLHRRTVEYPPFAYPPPLNAPLGVADTAQIPSAPYPYDQFEHRPVPADNARQPNQGCVWQQSRTHR